MRSLKEVLEKYDKIEEYLMCYVDHMTGQLVDELQDKIIERRWGIPLIRKAKLSYPSYSHWRFNRRHIYNKLHR
jgi:hypothetical protein